MIELVGVFLINWVATKSLNLLSDHVGKNDKQRRAFKCSLLRARRTLPKADRQIINKYIKGSLKDVLALKLTEFFKQNGDTNPQDLIKRIQDQNLDENTTGIDGAIERLFENFRVELSSHPDFIDIEGIRLSSQIKEIVKRLESKLSQEQDVDSIVETLSSCSMLDIQNFKKQEALLPEEFHPILTIDDNKINLDDLSQMVKNGDHIMLVGEPGIGKTTTSLQITKLLNVNEFFAGIFIPLPEWQSEDKDLFQYCASKAQFSSLIDEVELRLLALQLPLLLKG